MATPKKLPMPLGKRTSPADIMKSRQAIVKDMESRLQPDMEDPEAAAARVKKTSPSVVRGALVTGFKKPNTTA
jgi:hypothetical protein